MFKFNVSTNKIDPIFKQIDEQVYEGTLVGVRKAMFFAEGETKASFGKPGFPMVRSGHLRRSIQSGIVEKNRDTITGAVWSNLIYARIQELGGVVLPKKGPFMRFKIGGRWVTSYGYRIPPRPYLKPSVENNIDKIKEIIINSISKGK